jgi:hypothetical protein
LRIEKAEVLGLRSRKHTSSSGIEFARRGPDLMKLVKFTATYTFVIQFKSRQHGLDETLTS